MHILAIQKNENRRISTNKHVVDLCRKIFCLLFALVACSAILAAGPVGAAEYRAFTLADTGEQAYFPYVNMRNGLNGYAASWDDQFASIKIYQTEDGGRTWLVISQLATVMKPVPNSVQVILLPQVFLVRTGYWVAATTEMAGKLWASWDQGATWTEMTDPLRAMLNTQDWGVWTMGASESGIWLRVTSRNAEGLRSYVIYSQDQGATWAKYSSPVNFFNFTVTKGGYLAGYGYTPNGIQKVACFNQDLSQFDIISGGDLDTADINMLRFNWNGNVIGLIDNQMGNRTPNRIALSSFDGGMTWRTLFNSEVNAGDHPDQDFFSALAANDTTAYGVWHAWQFNADGTYFNTAYWIKKTTDFGATWTTLAESASGNYYYEPKFALDGTVWVSQLAPGMDKFTGGIFDLE